MQPEELICPQRGIIKLAPKMAFRVLPLASGTPLVVLGWALSAQAADIHVASKIEAVTVFPDAAQVRRVADADIPSGAHQLVFKGLPISLDVNSLRVRAVGAAGLVIGSVESRVAPLKVTKNSPLAEKLRALTNKQSLLSQKFAALRAKRAMIQRYAKISPEKFGQKATPMRVSDWDKAWNAVSDGLSKVAEEIQSVQIRQRQVSEEIRALRRSNRGKTSGTMARRIVSVSISGAATGKARLYLTYRVRAARWRSVYDARLQTAAKSGKSALELVRRASVVQWTGEDWNSVSLTVSTVRTNRGTQAPNLMAQRLEFYDPPPARPYPAARLEVAKNRANNNRKVLSAYSRRLAGRILAAAPAREQQTQVLAGAYEAQFRVPGKVDLKADNSARILRIDSQRIEPELLVRATPTLSAIAFLEARFVNKGDTPILPGIVNLHRDGVYVGRGRFTLVPPGDEAAIGFGADDSVRVKRTPVSRKQSGPGWIGNNRSQVQDFKTIVTNLHPFAVKVRILDRLPISEDDKIVVTPRPTNTSASEKNVDGRRGVLAFVFDLKPKTKKEIRLGWQVQWPEGKRIRPRNLPN